MGITLVAGISFVDDIHSLPDSVRLVFQFAAMALMFWCWGIVQLAICAGLILIPDTSAWHWSYLIAVCLVLGVGYILFMRKYYHLHAEYLESLKK